MAKTTPNKALEQRIQRLKEGLTTENPLLVDVVQSYLDLDRVAYAIGLLNTNESYATRISWWPFIAVLGTFSAGKSSFINEYTGVYLQDTGNQAVDDRFTAICYSRSKEVRVLPGYALDADPRFPFYAVSEEIEKVAPGEGNRIDSYLQLKTCPSERLKGRILIDSPGFDADHTRNAILRLTDHIIDLSDLVLVFFDARHPEPGAMKDTLEHLVSHALKRDDTSKFLFILNQIDTTAREDNFEQVVAAWQRALASSGMVSGRFYCTYNESAVVDMADGAVKARLASKRDNDLTAIHNRISEVSVERVYRVISTLENTATHIERDVIPKISNALQLWRKRVLTTDAVSFGLLLVIGLSLSLGADFWPGAESPAWRQVVFGGMLVILGLLAIGAHFRARKFWATRIGNTLAEKTAFGNLKGAWAHCTCWYRSIFASTPAGWSKSCHKRLAKIRESADLFVQKTNDRYADPAGKNAGK